MNQITTKVDSDDKINQYKERERNETKVLEWKKFKVLFCGLDHGARIRDFRS